jgi:adenylate kinase
MKNIIFIGGIHGVGKGTLCKTICDQLNIKHLSASEVLKWEEISDKKNKIVDNFTLTQNRLITNLEQIINNKIKYILDGHYCLLNSIQEPERIDFETFEQLNPFAFVVVIDDVQEIKIRLENRDKKEYDFELLLRFQEKELEYSKELSNKLSKPHLVLRKEEGHKLKTFLYNENFT